MKPLGNVRGWCRGLSFGLALLLAPVLSFAQQEETEKQEINQSQQQQQNGSQAQVELPQALKDLNLTDEQKQRIQQVVRQSNRQIAQTWQQFHQLHMQAVNLEAAMLATIEQSLSESQREEFRKSRSQQLESQPFAQRESQQGQQRQQAQQEQSQQQREQIAQRERQEDRQRPQRRESAFRPGSLQSQEDAPEHGILILGISVKSPREQFRQMGLSEEQQKKCGEACEKYTGTLRSTWKKLHALHLRMVDLEADKVAGIQEILTEEQLQKLQQATGDSERQEGEGQQQQQNQNQQESERDDNQPENP